MLRATHLIAGEWISDEAQFTNQSVAALRNEIDAGQGRRSAPDKQLGTNLEQGLSSLTGEATASTENRSRKSPSQQVAILCRHGDEIGRILTDRMAKTNKAVIVSFGSEDRIEEFALSDIELYEVVEL